MKIDQKDLDEISAQLPKENVYLKFVYDAMKKEVDKIQIEMIQEFEQHPISKEIDGGITAYNISETLNGITIDFPTAKDIFRVTPLPWATGRSWAQGIETGISGLGYYIKQKENSRSGLGVQSQKQIRSGVRFRNTKYISDLIQKYNKKILDLSKNTIL